MATDTGAARAVAGTRPTAHSQKPLRLLLVVWEEGVPLCPVTGAPSGADRVQVGCRTRRWTVVPSPVTQAITRLG
jgi:hypothetical protein